MYIFYYTEVVKSIYTTCFFFNCQLNMCFWLASTVDIIGILSFKYEY